jgi:hypothetical protein
MNANLKLFHRVTSSKERDKVRNVKYFNFKVFGNKKIPKQLSGIKCFN